MKSAADFPRDTRYLAVTNRPRRKLLQAGGLGLLGLTLPELFRVRAAQAATGAGPASAAPIRACILVFFYGGPSHVDTWDMKPEAPAEVRGEFKPIETSAPGIRVCEHLPLLAKQMHHVALVRSLHHPMRNHNSAAVEALCGRTPLDGDLELSADSSVSFPCYGAILSYALAKDEVGRMKDEASRSGAPSTSSLIPHPSSFRTPVLPAVALPHPMFNVVHLPGQTAGFLGPGYEPYQVNSDPSQPGFTPGELNLPAGLSYGRMERREGLLRAVETQLARTELLAGSRAASAPFQRAFSLLRSDDVRRGFDLTREPEPVRARYGRNKLGQSLLLARRLVEAGVPFVTVYDKFVNGQDVNWDSHQAVFKRSKDDLLPPADRGFSALIEDLADRGLLESTLILGLSEFGRTPKINTSAGRDHWPDCYTALLAGGGVRGGTVYGASDETGAFPSEDPVTPGDVAATLFWRFGIDPASEMRDITDRPWKLADGEPLSKLFSRS